MNIPPYRYFCWLLLWFFSCSDDDPGPDPGPLVDQVLIINEGNFSAANGTIDWYDANTLNHQLSAFEAEATLQKARVFQQQIFLVTNTPAAVEILDLELNPMGVISLGLDNPVDFVSVGSQGFVSDWGNINTAFTDDPDSFIAVVDLQQQLVVDSVMLESRPQGLWVVDEQIFVAEEGGSSITIIDSEDLSSRSLEVAAGPSNFVTDANGRLWVICTSGHLMGIDPQNLSVASDISGLTTGGFNEKLAYDQAANRILFLGGNNDTFTGLTTVYALDLITESVDPFIENGFSLYGIGIDPDGGEVYLGDSNAFQSTGTAIRYDSQGNQLDQFSTGIGPNGFIFL